MLIPPPGWKPEAKTPTTAPADPAGEAPEEPTKHGPPSPYKNRKERRAAEKQAGKQG